MKILIRELLICKNKHMTSLNLYKKHRWLICLFLSLFILFFSHSSFVGGQGASTLSVTIVVNPWGGIAPLNGVIITGTVSGSATGPINYTFYCDHVEPGTNITPDYAHRIQNINLETYPTPAGVCNSVYSNAGFYWAKIIAERGGVAAETWAFVPIYDRTLPRVTFFDVQPRNTMGSVTASWIVTDEGGLNRVELWRTTDSGNAPDSGGWTQIYARSISGNSFSGQTIDTPALGVYWYGVHVLDTAGNLGTEPSPIKVTIAIPDTTSPSIPTSLSATAVSTSQINLTWTASTDNIGVTGYRIYRGGTQIATSTTTSYSNTGLSASTTYTYTITAYDAANNESSQSNQASATTQTPPDTTAPARSGASPSGELAENTTQTTLSLSTNENATCRYATSSGISYSSMTNTFSSTGGTSHSTTVSGLQNGQTYTYYIRCQDTANNANSTDYTISFSVASPSPQQEESPVQQQESGGTGVRIENPLGEGTEIRNLLSSVGGAMRAIALAVGLILIIIAGIIIMTSGGNKERLEKGKKMLFWTLFGVAIVVSTSFIISLVEEIFSAINE